MTRGFAAFVLAALLSGATTAWATAMAPREQDSAWQSYFTQRTHQTPAMRFPHHHCFERSAARYDLPVSLLLAVARGESDFDTRAVSHANAHGLMQILWPGTARHLGIHRLSELYDPCTNVDAGARYLVELLNRYDGNLHLALAAYNYGPSRVPVNGRGVPKGAAWYSSYIYRHLGFVLGGRRPADGLYDPDGKIEVALFGAPYRAESFVDVLQASAPDVRLDWFRESAGRFRVVMLYDDREEFDAARAKLAAVGFMLESRR